MRMQEIQNRRPLVQCITNAVTVNDCANILLAAGASPTMAHHPQEAAEISAGCDALVCNFGAIADYEAMKSAALMATKLRHPIVIDPVGVSGALIEGRHYYDAFVLGAKSNGVYALVQKSSKLTAPILAFSSQTVTATKPSGAEEMRYTVDGTDPRYSDSAKVYTAGVAMTSGATFRVAAFAEGKFTSDVVDRMC